MKRLLVFAAVLLAAAQLFGQSERRLLTMEEAILSRSLSPERCNAVWQSGSVYQIVERDSVRSFDARSGQQLSAAPRTEAKRSTKQSTPELFTRDNNLYCTLNGVEVAITTETDPNIVSGQAVSRNEFGIDGGIFLSPDQSKVAFYQKDESRVTDFPLLDITTRTGTLKSIKYPMNGMASEIVRLGIWDIATGKTVWADVTDFDQERYLACITWSPDSEKIYIQVLDRSQKEMHLNAYDASTGEFLNTLFTDTDSRYVEPQERLQFVADGPDCFIYQTNVRDGYWGMYLYDLKKGTSKRLAAVDADVHYVADDGRWVYYYSAEVSPAEQQLFKVNIASGKCRRLTAAEGWHNCQISPDGKWFIDNYSSLRVPRVVNVTSTDGKYSREIFSAPDPTKGYNYCPIELGTIKSADGRFDNYYRLIYPIDFDPAKKYPVILYVYGGPHSQMVNNSYLANLRRWEMLMAQKGYVVFVMDNRGTDNHGAEYEKAIHRHCGQAEMDDQMKGIEWLTSHPWVDSERIGVHGWSYGGFMTISLMTTYPEVFKVGVAGGPVIDWKWYEVMYGERYMETAETNPEGFAQTSLIDKAKRLEGKLLICQGAVDNTVVWQHSLNFVDECIKENIQLDYFPYPRAEHNVFGRDRVHLMNKVTDYFDTWL